MKNFGTLFGYEMKKIWKRPMTWAAVLLFSAAFVFITLQPFFASGGASFAITDANGKEISQYLTRGEQYRIQVAGARSLSGRPIDEKFFAGAKNIPNIGEFGDSIYWKRMSYFMLVDPSYYDFYTSCGEFLADTAERYYAHRQGGVESAWTYLGLTEEETAYWARMEARVEKPFTYQPILGPRMLMNMLGSGGLEVFLPILVGLCVCDLYAQERRSRAHGLIFSSRQGRLCLYLAKALAGALSAVLAVLAVAVAGAAANLLAYGPWGFDGAVQLNPWLWGCSLPITMGQGILILLALLLTYALVCGAATALASVWSGSGVTAMSVSVGVMLLSAVMDRTEPGWRAYLPANLVDERGLMSLQLANLFGVQLNLPQSGLLLYLALAAVLTALCWFGWRRNYSGKGVITPSA